MDVVNLSLIFAATLSGALIGAYCGLRSCRTKQENYKRKKSEKTKEKKTKETGYTEPNADGPSPTDASIPDRDSKRKRPLKRISKDSSYTDLVCEGDGADTSDYILDKMKTQEKKFVFNDAQAGLNHTKK